MPALLPRRLAAVGTLVLAAGVALAGPADAAPPQAGYRIFFSVHQSADGHDGNVLGIGLRCPDGAAGLELDVHLLLAPRDPAYDPAAVPPTGASTEDRAPAGFPLYVECAGVHRHTVDLFPDSYGYDLPGESPCSGYCHYLDSPLLTVGQKVDLTWTAYTDSGAELGGSSRARVKA